MGIEHAHIERRDKPGADIQETRVANAVCTLLPLARLHQLIITHGQRTTGRRAPLDSANDPGLCRPCPFDVLGARPRA